MEASKLFCVSEFLPPHERMSLHLAGMACLEHRKKHCKTNDFESWVHSKEYDELCKKRDDLINMIKEKYPEKFVWRN